MSSDETDLNPDAQWVENDVLAWWEANKTRYTSQDMLTLWQGMAIAIGASLGSSTYDAQLPFSAARQTLADLFDAAFDEMEKAYDCDGQDMRSRSDDDIRAVSGKGYRGCHQ
jgi:hypothetical protein